MADKNDFAEIISEMLIKQDKTIEVLSRIDQRLEKIEERQNRSEKAFNTAFEAMLNKMDEFTTEVKGLRQDFQKFADLEDRVKKLEETVFRKGA